MCTCTCDKKIDENGRIKSICMRDGCNQPIYIRGYSSYSKDNPLFCGACWEWVYAVTDVNLHRDGIEEYFIDETKHWINQKVSNTEWYKNRESYKQKVIDSIIK